ncbi:hypothetical protein [Rhodococcus sp. IEGM 1330]|uniref:hypothetical protein n=1 Tax=Rhodococcus sp. IEGM 1330 TaxID=3082225 RepID=UPI0029558521|nr:hypothetical protein [Rhodococcus sp. IEGM 1330]MDV8022502.1 hypothetical protein [Rhodococcus sp. IEGM 1330]
MTRTEQLLQRVRSHVAGETRESLHRAGFHDREIDRQIRFGHLREARDGRIRYVHRDPTDELETR